MEISAGEFKAKCLKLMDEVARTHETVIITKRGRPVVRMVPVEDEGETSLFGYMTGTAAIHGDIIGPIEVAWEALDESGKRSE